MANFNETLKRKLDYMKQFEVILPQLAKDIDPNTFYWLASPSSFGGFDKPNDENYGDMHDWSVFNVRAPFTLSEDRNIFSYVMERYCAIYHNISNILRILIRYYMYPS